MSIKLHFLHSHLSRLPEKLGDVSDEQGERFHRDISDMEVRYQGRWDATILADYCWSIKCGDAGASHSRKSQNINMRLTLSILSFFYNFKLYS